MQDPSRSVKLSWYDGMGIEKKHTMPPILVASAFLQEEGLIRHH